MDRNSVLGIVVIVFIIIIFSIINKKQQEKEALTNPIVNKEMSDNRYSESEPVPVNSKDAAAPQMSLESTTVDTQNIYGAFSRCAGISNDTVTLENNLMRIKISGKGGNVIYVELLNYKTYDGKPLVLFEGDSSKFNLIFPTSNNRNINTGEMVFTPLSDRKIVKAVSSKDSVVMRMYVADNNYIEYSYKMSPDDYMVDFDIRFKGLDSIIANNVNIIDLYWQSYALQLEKGKVNENNYTSLVYKYYQDEVESVSSPKKDSKNIEVSTKLKWVAFKGQFFSSVLIAKQSFLNGVVDMQVMPDSSKYLKKFSSGLVLPFRNLPEEKISFSFYFGPNHMGTLKKYEGLELRELVSVGKNIVKVINQGLIIPVFNFLNNYIDNYGIIILMLTIILKIILFPLTYRSYLSMAKMRVLKPEIDLINERIPKDKAIERQQATMKLYRKAGVSPLGGCIPMLLQMPILYAMFRFFPTSIELRQEPFLWAADLSTYDSILDLPFYIPMYGDHVSLFTILMTVSTVVTMKISNQAASSANQMPGMKTMMYIMPVMFMFILNNFSSALTYYYFLANVITYGQNLIFKYSIDDEKILSKIEKHKAKPVKRSKFQERIEKMAKQKGYQLPKK